MILLVARSSFLLLMISWYNKSEMREVINSSPPSRNSSCHYRPTPLLPSSKLDFTCILGVLSANFETRLRFLSAVFSFFNLLFPICPSLAEIRPWMEMLYDASRPSLMTIFSPPTSPSHICYSISILPSLLHSEQKSAAHVPHSDRPLFPYEISLPFARFFAFSSLLNVPISFAPVLLGNFLLLTISVSRLYRWNFEFNPDLKFWYFDISSLNKFPK